MTLIGAISWAFDTAVEHMATPQHIPLLLRLSMIAQLTLLGMCMSALACDIPCVRRTVSVNRHAPRIATWDKQPAMVAAFMEFANQTVISLLCCLTDGTPCSVVPTLLPPLANLQLSVVEWLGNHPQQLSPGARSMGQPKQVTTVEQLPLPDQVGRMWLHHDEIQCETDGPACPTLGWAPTSACAVLSCCVDSAGGLADGSQCGSPGRSCHGEQQCMHACASANVPGDIGVVRRLGSPMHSPKAAGIAVHAAVRTEQS